MQLSKCSARKHVGLRVHHFTYVMFMKLHGSSCFQEYTRSPNDIPLDICFRILFATIL